MKLYRWFDEQEEKHREAIRSADPVAIDLWQRALEIRARPFLEGSTHYPGPTETLEEKLRSVSAEFRMSQAILSISTSKVALDACMGGYYSQALALIRGLFESWKRMAYARRSSIDSYRWYPRAWMPAELLAELGPRYVQSKPKAAEWEKVFPVDAPSGSLDARDRILLGWVNDIVEELNDHTHPTYLGFTQHLGESRSETLLHPEFDGGLAFYTLHKGCVAEFSLIHELWELLVLDDEWQVDAEEWKEEFRLHFAKQTSRTDGEDEDDRSDPNQHGNGT